MELILKLDDSQLTMLSEMLNGRLSATMRRHLKRHHHIKQKKLKGG